MILSEIRRYLEQRTQASLADLALHFDVPPDVLRGMLAVWIRKGRVEKRLATTACGSSCQQCQLATTEIYVWREARPHPAPKTATRNDHPMDHLSC